jgi:hypothetical protein
MVKKTKTTAKPFTVCPCCAYEAGTKPDDTKPGGRRFGHHVRSIASKLTRIPATKIAGPSRGEQFSHARVAIILAMRELAAEVSHPTAGNWPNCSKIIGRDKGSSHRLFNTWRDNPTVIDIASKIVAEHRGAS